VIVAIADTHAAVWHLFNNPRLSLSARNVIEEALQAGHQIGVSSISLVEMVYLSEKERIPLTAVHDLIRALIDPEHPLHELPVDASIAEQMLSISREQVPEMPDRILAATGARYGVPILSRDRKIQASHIQTIW